MDEIKKATHEVEIRNCAESFVYFCEKYVKIAHPLRGLVPFILHDYQKRYIEHINENRFVIAKKFRQGGFSTLTIAWLLWRFLFKLDERNMVLSRSDREAVELSWLMRHMIKQLPDFLKPNLSKENDHRLENDELNNHIWFFKPEAACGKAVNYLFIDESAFIKDMHQHWKAIMPTLSTGGSCITVSSTNGKHGWFYDIYNLAETGRNDFRIFRSNYWEHPDYADEDWASGMKGNLGARGWRQEVLCEFLDPDPRNQQEKFEDALNYFDEVMAAEEFVQSLKKETSENKLLERDKYLQRKKEEKWSLEANKGPADLIWEFEEPYKEAKKAPEVKLDEGEKIVGRAYQFKKMSPSEAKLFVENYMAKSRPVEQAKFDNFSLRNSRDMAGFWADLAEIRPEYSAEKNRWQDHVERAEENEREVEERLNEGIDPDMLALAGVISTTAAKAMPHEPYARPDGVIMGKVEAKFKNLSLSFRKGRLCVNKVPTTLMEDDLRDLYNGTFALKSYKEAVDATVKVIEDKLSPLFEKAGGDNGRLAEGSLE